MGMYDHLRCHHPLPDCPVDPARLSFQTKSLSDTMDDVVLTRDGELRHDVWEYESVPKAERPYPDDDGILGIAGSLRRRVIESDVLLDFSGVLYFYDAIPNLAFPNGHEPLDYYALMDKGHLQIVLRLEEERFWDEEDALPVLKEALRQREEEKRLQGTIPEAQAAPVPPARL
jgi:hypothetical protein